MATFSLYPVDCEMKYIHTGDTVFWKACIYTVGKIDSVRYTLELWTCDDDDVSILFKIIDYLSNRHCLLLDTPIQAKDDKQTSSETKENEKNNGNKENSKK